MKVRSPARYRLYRKASLRENERAYFWRRQGGMAGQRQRKTWQRLGLYSPKAKKRLRPSVLVQQFFSWKASICCLCFTSRFRAWRFEELDAIVMDAEASEMGLVEVVFFLVCPILDPVFCFFQSSALLLISKGKALIQLLLPSCAFHFFIYWHSSRRGPRCDCA